LYLFLDIECLLELLQLKSLLLEELLQLGHVLIFLFLDFLLIGDDLLFEVLVPSLPVVLYFESMLTGLISDLLSSFLFVHCVFETLVLNLLEVLLSLLPHDEICVLSPAEHLLPHCLDVVFSCLLDDMVLLVVNFDVLLHFQLLLYFLQSYLGN
jgi:hypothetical protein